ncbi:MAG TPA: aminotransferase class IV [Oligoflexus sp.]|uniref:aminotransferase class IV n=1 Tax=Oligoflexus sp. TaxID=1971216 RepID=UPI002D445E0A|nr:aminotransferase class IV [Oligoflexus sp.]HYX34062.1 aminotransferase class IV [Oligoflexus sp.]
MAGLVSVNGQITPAAEGLIPAQDRGFLFGDAIYEMIAGREGKLIDFAAHLARLRRAAEISRMAFPWTDQELRFECEHLVGLTKFSQSALRIMITRGSSPSLRIEAGMQPNRYIYCLPSPLPAPAQYEMGLQLKAKKHPWNPRGPQLKSPNYLHAATAQAEVQAEGYDDVLWMNADAEFTEAGSANIFLISRQGDLVEIATPPPTAGILPGITRARVMELLRRSQIPVTERSITSDELPRFDEGFVTSSLRGPFPVSRIDKHRLHSTRPQAVFQHILRLYRSWESHEGDGNQGDGSPLN